MQAFFQGKIDNFCAVYAVLNAMQVLYGLGVHEARAIFNRTLLRVSRDAAGFERILSHRTDYAELVDGMLADLSASGVCPGLRVEKPFGPGAPHERVWEALRAAATPPVACVSVFRFLRFAAGAEKPYVDHWTTGHFMDMEGLHLLDCSLEQGGLYCIPFSRTTDACSPRVRDCVVIPPESVRILSASGSPALPV